MDALDSHRAEFGERNLENGVLPYHSRRKVGVARGGFASPVVRDVAQAAASGRKILGFLQRLAFFGVSNQ